MTAQPLQVPNRTARLRVVQGRLAVAPSAITWMIATVAVTVVFFGLIISRTALDQSALELDQIRSEINAEQSRYDALRIDVARLRSPARIEPLAEQMGLVFPQEIHRVTAEGVIVISAETDWAARKSIVSASP